MRRLGFPMGGIRLPGRKDGAASPIADLPPPDLAWVPLSQHIGAPALPAVGPGDRVRVGSLVGRADGAVSANVHAPVSGRVERLDSVPDPGGFPRPAMLIRREGDDWEPAIRRGASSDPACLARLASLDREAILAGIQAGGLVGAGGAAFPTHLKYLIPNSLAVDTLIVNGIECEPWLCGDHRLMLECPDEVLLGAELLRRALGVLRAVIAVEADKLDAARLLAARAAALGLAPAGRPLGWRRGQTAAGDGIFIAICRRRYPQGSEKQLVKAVLGREVPSGKLPVNVGAVVNNVGTAGAACRILRDGQPVVDRVLTVAGRGVKRPGNYRARIGTPIGVLLDAAGARPAGRSLVVLGGPMMGKAACSLDTPVAKGTAGVLLLDEPDREAGPCIRCGRCAEACPMGLEPWRLELLVGAGADEASFAGQLRDCLECGSCAWGCPARRPLLEAIRLGKARFARKA